MYTVVIEVVVVVIAEIVDFVLKLFKPEKHYSSAAQKRPQFSDFKRDDESNFVLSSLQLRPRRRSSLFRSLGLRNWPPSPEAAMPLLRRPPTCG